jgi:DNA-binding Lrp family transcriptional regulator
MDNTLTPEQQLALRQQLEKGLPLCAQPYAELAKRLALDEQRIIQTIEQWQQQGLIKRLGAVINHRKLGYVANGMWVIDVPDEQINHLGQQLSRAPEVTLCYQRPRRLPDWRFNLFCMIHGKSRPQVLATIERLCHCHQIDSSQWQVLFSYQAFKQRGGHYVSS